MKLKNLIVVFFVVLILLILAFIGSDPANRTGPENGLIQSDHQIWKDVPLQRQDVIDAEQRLLKKSKEK